MESEIIVKFTQITNILNKAYEAKKKGKQASQSKADYTVGIISSLDEEDILWISRELRCFNEHVINIQYVNPTHASKKELEKVLAEFTFHIYVSSGERWKKVITSDQRRYTLSTLGKKKVLIVLLTDMEDISDEEKKRIIKGQPGMEKFATAVFLFGKMEKGSAQPGSANAAPSWRTSDPPQAEYSGPNVFNGRNPEPYRPPPPYPQLPDSKGLQADISQEPVKRKHIVGIFTRSAEEDFTWLVKLLQENFQDYVGGVRNCYISNTQQNLQEEMSQCTFGIIYHTKKRGRVNITDVKESLYTEELEALCDTLGRENVLVLIDDLEDSGDREKIRILHTQPGIHRWACDLILISEEEKANNPELVTKLKSLTFIFGAEDSEPSSPNTRDVSPPPTPDSLSQDVAAPSRSSVAIFSRSEERDYSWLIVQLSEDNLDIRHYKIPAENHPQEKAFKCKLVILYHSRKHGKIHLTDRKEALYHEDLETLSAKFGKRKVIVVIDDLEDSGDKVKGEILHRQPSVGRFTGEIFLFSKEEKKHLGKMGTSKAERKIMEKIGKIKDMLKK